MYCKTEPQTFILFKVPSWPESALSLTVCDGGVVHPERSFHFNVRWLKTHPEGLEAWTSSRTLSGSLDYSVGPIWFGSAHLSLNVQMLYHDNGGIRPSEPKPVFMWGRVAVNPWTTASSEYSTQPSRHKQNYSQAFWGGLIWSLTSNSEQKLRLHVIITQSCWEAKYSVFGSSTMNSISKAPYFITIPAVHDSGNILDSLPLNMQTSV